DLNNWNIEFCIENTKRQHGPHPYNKKIHFHRIHCEIEEYSEIISKWFKMFDLASDKNFKNYIKIYKEKTIYCINESENEINGKIIHTDLYPLLYNIIANIINNKNNMLLHSTVLWYNNKEILVLGDFGSGKT
ncbi:MAG: hypothetical protein RR201_03500, partial [Malacoplasma sp.]